MFHDSIVLSGWKEWQWCHDFNNGHINVHDEEWSKRPCVETRRSCWKYEWASLRNCYFMNSVLAIEFPSISPSKVYKIITIELGYHKLCARWFMKMLTDAHKIKDGICMYIFGSMKGTEITFFPYHNRWWNIDFVC